MAYSIIPEISQLEEPLLSEVRNAFAESLKIIWQVMIGISGLGLLTVVLMKEVEMRMDVDSQWALEEKKDDADESVNIRLTSRETN